MNNKIKLIALDIDGVISKGMKSKFNYTILNILANMNCKAKKNPEHPPVTLITGRPQPYVEALLQVIKGFVPAVFEQGTGCYNPESYTVSRNPALGNIDKIYEIKQFIISDFVNKNIATLQPGKEYTISIYSSDNDIHLNLKKMITEKNGEWENYFDFIYSSNCLNIIPKGFHKGKGIDLLSEYSGIPVGNILGVGDSDVDIPFLKKAGISAAPANAPKKVKDVVDFTASKYYQDGLFEILDYYGLLP